MAKEFTIIQYRIKFNELTSREITGSMEYFLNYFGYTLDVGRSWQHEKGNHKIPTSDKIKTPAKLVKALNDSETNKSINGNSDVWYSLKETQN